jgi:DNA-binding transcriptional LysR family regulator
MTIDELEAFVAVARASNIGVAAKRLGVPQATLSDRLRRLETGLGRLFERRPRPPWVTLTELGARLLPNAIEAIDAAARLRGPRTVPPRRPAVRIGVNQSIEHAWLFEWLTRLRRQHATMELALRVDTTDALEDAVARADIDLAVASRPLGDRDVEKRQLPSLSMAFVGSAARHRGDKYPLEVIAAGGLVTFQSGSRVHRNLLKLLKSVDIEGCRVDQFSSIPSIIKAVQEGFGVATLPERLVVQAPQHRLRVLPCDAALPPLPVWLSWPAEQGRDASAVVASIHAFIDDSLT